MAALVCSAKSANGFSYAVSPPQLVIDKTRHDFGEVFTGEQLSQVFLARNVGSSPLELSATPILPARPVGASLRLSPGESFPRVAAIAPRLARGSPG